MRDDLGRTPAQAVLSAVCRSRCRPVERGAYGIKRHRGDAERNSRAHPDGFRSPRRFDRDEACDPPLAVGAFDVVARSAERMRPDGSFVHAPDERDLLQGVVCMAAARPAAMKAVRIAPPLRAVAQARNIGVAGIAALVEAKGGATLALRIDADDVGQIVVRASIKGRRRELHASPRGGVGHGHEHRDRSVRRRTITRDVYCQSSRRAGNRGREEPNDRRQLSCAACAWLQRHSPGGSSRRTGSWRNDGARRPLHHQFHPARRRFTWPSPIRSARWRRS